MRTLFFAGLCALGLAVPPVQAGEATDPAGIRRVVEAMGLMGDWGVDCNAMPSSTEWETIQVTDKGEVLSVEGGDDAIFTYRIIAAERLSATDIRMKFLYLPEDGTDAEGETEISPDQATTVIYRVEGDRQMTWFSAGPDGEPVIKDGRWLAGDDPDRMSQWYLRCPGGPHVPGEPQ